MQLSATQYKGPILIGVGANLASDRFGTPLDACEAAIQALAATSGVRVVARSRWFESQPVPVSDQPWFINGVVRVETDFSPQELLDVLHTIEAQFGRVRTVPNAPRVLDLDLLAYGDAILGQVGEGGIQIPHPRMENRAFVLFPLSDVAPDWVHPQGGRSLADLRARLPQNQVCRALE